jgi:hypothetical protein
MPSSYGLVSLQVGQNIIPEFHEFYYLGKYFLLHVDKLFFIQGNPLLLSKNRIDLNGIILSRRV